MYPSRNQTSLYFFSDDVLCQTSDQTLSISFLTIDCVQSVTKRLNARLWLSDVSNQWQNVSILLLWRSTVSNQWPKHLRTSAVRIDYFCSRLLVDYPSTSRLIVDYFSYKTRATFQRCTWQINKRLSMGWSCSVGPPFRRAVIPKRRHSKDLSPLSPTNTTYCL